MTQFLSIRYWKLRASVITLALPGKGTTASACASSGKTLSYRGKTPFTIFMIFTDVAGPLVSEAWNEGERPRAVFCPGESSQRRYSMYEKLASLVEQIAVDEGLRARLVEGGALQGLRLGDVEAAAFGEWLSEIAKAGRLSAPSADELTPFLGSWI